MLNSRPIPSNRDNPCPVCAKTDGACRILPDETIFCHGLADAKKFEKFNGYICISPAKNGHTATFRPDNSAEWTEDRRREWEARKVARQQASQQEEQTRQERALSAGERHRLYSEILDQLSLDNTSLDDLEKRGFSKDEIQKCEFKSVQKWHNLSQQYDTFLPGIGKGNDSLIVPGDGCICPVRNVYGQVVGAQIRLYDPVDSNRYLWMSSQKASVKTKEFNELPLGIFIPSNLKSLDIHLVEGLSFKAYLASERLGTIVIGASGGNHASSLKTLKHAIETIQEVLCQIVENGSKSAKPETFNNDSSKNGEGEKKPSDNQTFLSSTLEYEKKAWLYRRLSQLINSNPSLMATNGSLSGQRYLDIQRQGNTSSRYTSQFIIIPDAGSVCNAGVANQYKRTSEVLRSLSFTPVFAWWGQVDKSFRDIDELQSEQLTDIRYLSLAEFEALCIKWGGLVPSGTGFKTTAPIDFQQRVASAQKKLHTLSYPADLLCDPSKKYLPDLVGRIPTKGVVFLKSPKGSGKSHQIKKIKQHCCGRWSEKITYPEVPELLPEQLNIFTANKQPLPASPEPIVEKVWNPGLGMKFISITARIALGREQAIRWEFTYIEDADIDGGKEEFGIKLATESIIENIKEIGLCPDSVAKLKHRDWSNTLIVIDEIELVLNHVSTSSTCRDKRSEILQVIQDKIKESLDNGGLLIGADADITHVTVDYLKALAPNHPPFIVKHDFKGDPWEINYYTGKRDIVLSQIEEHLSDSECEPITVAIDNQKEAEALSIHLARKYPYLGRETGGLIRIDSKVTQQDYGKDFVKKPNESIDKYQPKILIYTPSLGVGCSIDLEYFGHVYGLFFGNLEPSQCRQMLARVRESVPRTVWAKVRAGNSEDESTSYLPEEIKKRFISLHDPEMRSLAEKWREAVEVLKSQGIENPEDSEVLPVYIELLTAMAGKDGTWNNAHIDLHSKQIARRNFSLSQLAVQLRQELIEEGHHITDEEGEEKTNAGDAVTAGKEEIKRRDANLTANAEDIPFEDAQELKRKAARTTEEEHKINKAFLKHDLPELNLTADFIYKAVHKDNGRWLNQAKLFWHLEHQDALVHKDEKHWKLKLSQFSKGVTCLWDVRTDTPKIEAILKSGLLDWVKKFDDLETEYSSESEGGQDFLDKALANKKQIKTALGITVRDNSSPIKLANKILDRLGLKLAYSRRTQTTKYYKLDEELAIDRDRLDVFYALDRKWLKEKEVIAQNKPLVTVTEMTNENNILINNQAWSSNNKPEELAQNHVVDHTTEDWLKPENLADTANLLEACENADMLADVRAAVPSYALKEACKLLPKFRLIQIKQWVLQLNSLMVAQAEEVAEPSQQDESLTADAVVLLQSCESVEMLAGLRSCFADCVIKRASERIPAALNRWVCDWMTYWDALEKHAPA